MERKRNRAVASSTLVRFWHVSDLMREGGQVNSNDGPLSPGIATGFEFASLLTQRDEQINRSICLGILILLKPIRGGDVGSSDSYYFHCNCGD